MGVFACLELSSEKCEAIHLLQNVVKTLESSLIQIADEKKQHDGNVGKLTFQGVGKFATCQDIRKRTCQNEIHHSGTDVSIQEPPGIQEKLAPELNTEHEKKDESSLEWNTTRMQKDKPVRSADVDVTKMQNITRENNHLKEELWKLVSVSGEHPLVTPGSDTSAPMIVGNVLEELISKAVFFVELSHGPVEVVDLVQRHLATVAPVVVVAKRKRGRPPRNKPLSPAPSIPAQPTRRGRRRKDPRIIGMMQCLAQGEELLREGRKRKTTGDSADGERNTRGTKLHKTAGKYLVSAPEEDCTGRDIKTDVVPSGAIAEEANADSDTTVIYDEATDSDASLQKQQSTERMKRELKLKAKFRSKMPAMSARHKCEICRAAFSHGRPFKRHLLKHGEGDVSCQRCHDEFQNYALFLHHQCRGDPASRLRRGIEQKCTLCAEMFHNRKKLQHHMNVVHNRKLDPVFFCEYCNKGFVKQASLYVHYKQHADGQHVCTKCGRFFEDEKAFAMHENTHAGCRKYTCKKCEETFTRRQQYMQHLDGHKKYDCLMCGQKFSTNKMLEQHNKNIHGIELKTKMYGCDYCGKKYPRPGLLELHLRTHTGEKPLECGPCCLFFRTPKALYRHRQTFGHMQKAGLTKKERSHLCATCGRSYFRKQALDRHMRYHSGIKPHQCPHCSYETREHNNLKRHIALHFSRRDFICETCGDAFHAKKTLEVHVLYKHSDERPLQCTDCEMTFKTKNSLKRHRLIHQNLRLHKCAICEMSFNRFYNLRRHMRMVHGTEDPLPAPNKVRVLDAPAGQEYRRPYRPPIKRSSRSVDTVPSGVSHNQLTVDPAENPVSLCEGSSMDHPRANPKHYTNLVPSTPEGANLVQLLPVIRHVPTITPSMLPQVNYVPISAAISDAIGGATVAVPHQLVGASTMTTMQGLYHPPQPLLHPQAPPRQPTDPLQPPHTSISANISQDNQPDFSSMDIYSNLLRLMHPPCS